MQAEEVMKKSVAAVVRRPGETLGYLDTRTGTKTKYRDLSTAQRTIRPSVATTPANKCARWGPRSSGRDDVCFGLGGREQATTKTFSVASEVGINEGGRFRRSDSGVRAAIVRLPSRCTAGRRGTSALGFQHPAAALSRRGWCG